MVLPGTFMPFFFPLGIAFMGSQSAVMMKMAGEQWQYGKRRISAMTNEEFNKLTPLKLYEIETSDLRAMIPLMQESMRDMNKLTPIIVTEMIGMFKDFINGIFGALQSETDKHLHPLFNFILSFYGFDQKNIGSSLDFDNTADKFRPPINQRETLPVRTPERKPKKTQRQLDDERKERDERLQEQVTTAGWQKVVGPGKTRKQLLLLVTTYKNLTKASRKAYQHTLSVSPASRILKLQKRKWELYQTLLRHHMDALNWVNRNNKPTP